MIDHTFGSAYLDRVVSYAFVLGQVLSLQPSQQGRVAGSKAERPETGIEIVGSSAATRRLIDTLDMFLPSTARADAPPILVTGESENHRTAGGVPAHFRGHKARVALR